MDRREFFKVLLLTVSGAFVKLPVGDRWIRDGVICDGCDSDGVIDLSNFYPRHEVAESPDKWWAGDDVKWYSHDNGTWQLYDGPIGTYRRPRKFEGLDKLIFTGHAEGGHKTGE